MSLYFDEILSESLLSIWISLFLVSFVFCLIIVLFET